MQPSLAPAPLLHALQQPQLTGIQVYLCQCMGFLQASCCCTEPPAVAQNLHLQQGQDDSAEGLSTLRVLPPHLLNLLHVVQPHKLHAYMMIHSL